MDGANERVATVSNHVSPVRWEFFPDVRGARKLRKVLATVNRYSDTVGVSSQRSLTVIVSGSLQELYKYSEGTKH
jgi:hypothetical protein